MFFTAVCIILILHFIVALPTAMRDELAMIGTTSFAAYV